MPELSRFFNIIVRMQFNDVGQHNKPHIHVQYSEYKAVVALDGTILSGSLPAKQFKMLEAWMIIHEEELYKSWNDAVRSIPLTKIDPLK